jgi:hypothetical protein
VPNGTVAEVKQGNPFKQIRVTPAAKLNRLEEVIVLLTQEPVGFKSEPEAQGGAPAAPSNSPAAQSSGPAAVPAAEKP